MFINQNSFNPENGFVQVKFNAGFVIKPMTGLATDKPAPREKQKTGLPKNFLKTLSIITDWRQ